MVWIRWPAPWWLAAGAAAVVGAVFTGAARGRWRAYAAAALISGLAAGFIAHSQLRRLPETWATRRERRETQVSAELRARLDALLTRGEEAVAQAAELGAQPSADTVALFAALEAVRRRAGMSAVAIYDAGARLVAWAGDHRGPMPPAVERGEDRYVFAERPLFSYLYFTAPVRERGGTAVAAALMRASPLGPGAGAPTAFAAEMEALTGERLLISRAERAAGAAVWDLKYRGGTLLSVSLAEAAPAVRSRALRSLWSRVVAGAAGVAFVFLFVGWRRGREGEGWAPALVLLLAVAVLPFGALVGAERLFAPAWFLLPGPVGATLGRLLALAAASWVVLGAARAPRTRDRPWVAALVVGAAFPLLLAVLRQGASVELLAGGTGGWFCYQLTAVMLLGVVALAAVRLGARAGGGKGVGPRRRRALAAGVALAAALGAAMVVVTDGRPAPYGVAALWAIPTLLVARGLGASRRWLDSMFALGSAGTLAVTAALPWALGARTEARMRVAERELRGLGTHVDPYLEFLFHRFEQSVDSLEALGAGDVELLYGAWVGSGLAAEGYSLWLTLWSGSDAVREELPVGVAGARPPIVDDLLAEARRAGRLVVRRYERIPEAHYLAYVPLPDGAVISVAVPPRRWLAAGSPLAPVLGLATGERDPLMLVPAPPGVPERRDVRWVRTERGWQGETWVHYPEGVYHAHYILPRPAVPVLVARGFLLLAANLALLFALWAAGRAAAGGEPAGVSRWRAAAASLTSFRARVTLALFVFFLAPTILFGTLAYRTLAGAAQRVARALAERAVDDGALRYVELGGDLPLLARRVGADLLLYRDGALEAASTRELVELGFYGAWLPARVHRLLASGEVVVETELDTLGGREYVVAYRRMPDGAVLASPAPLVVAATTLRGREVADLLAFAVALGALLSLALALGVGRMLAGPIGSLREAAERVGRGDLGVQLPEERADEFGTLFAEFNRMVQRLQRARAEELRSERILAWGEMARQVAHAVKNPLTPIKLSVQHIRRAFEDGHPDFPGILTRNVDTILREIERLASLARGLTRFAAPAPGAARPLEPVDVRAVVEETLGLYAAGADAVTYASALAVDLPPVCARGDELKEVLVNLLENARAAITEAGTITVEARAHDGEVELAVRDDGAGIAPELLPRIFEPHFSTRSSGSGLGLAIVRRLVESWGGQVSAESGGGRGTVLRLRLKPWAPAASGVPRASGAPGDPGAGDTDVTV